MSVRLQLQLNDYTDAVAARTFDWATTDTLARIWARDHTVWSPEPVAELTDRLGWLDLPERLAARLTILEEFGRELVADGITHVVVLGMGGSSLAPSVFARTFGSTATYPQLRVLDSTHPAAVLAVAEAIDIAKTVFVVASKSGTTVEPLSFMEYFWDRVGQITETPGAHFVATTDPGSRLEDQAVERGFRRVFLAPPDVGGRYSVLTDFGMVPAAAIGADLRALQAAAMAEQTGSGPDATVATSAGCRLGAAMGELAIAGRDKITFLTSPDISALPAWIEQLIAESTGKRDTGIVPIGGEHLPVGAEYGDDRFFVIIETAGSEPIDTTPLAGHPVAHLRLDEVTDIAGVMYMFELATALAGAVLGIQPFDQPDVQLAKVLARDAMAGKLDTSEIVEIDAMGPELGAHVAGWLGQAGAGDYVGIHAFIQPTAHAQEALAAARRSVGGATGLATTLDFGPRFLHSTGQLHKGGANNGVFLEIVDHPQPFVPVPTTDYDFGKLIDAQALGDHLALRRRERRVLLVSLGDDGDEALDRVVTAVVTAAAS